MKKALLIFVLCGWVGIANAQVNLGTLLDRMIDRDDMARLPDFTCRQASSYDRASTIPEVPSWFANSDHTQYIRTEINQGRTERVMMDATGPGAITRWWVTSNVYNGYIRIYLNGATSPTVTARVDSLIGGTTLVSAPLSEVTSSGRNLYLPIPYSQSCKVTFDSSDLLYYNINYITFDAGITVQSFSLSELGVYATKITQTKNALLNPQNVIGTISDTQNTQAAVNMFESLQLDVSGPAAIRTLAVSITEDGAVPPDFVLENVYIELTFDGERTALVPVAEFFGSGYGVNAYTSWWRKTQASGLFTCYWPMPFQTEATITIHNQAAAQLDVTIEAASGPWTWDTASMYFHSGRHGQSNVSTADKQDWNIIEITGQGVYAGDTLTLYNPVSDWWGEGDEKVWVDYEGFPSHFGTGTEDYYGYAWGNPTYYTAPFHAQPRADGPGSSGHVVNTRTRSLDRVPFDSHLQFDIEIWHWATTLMDYATTSYWYARPGAMSNTEEPVFSALGSDEFDDANVHEGWSWIDSDSDDAYNTTSHSGFLRISLSSGVEDDWYNLRFGCPYLVQPMPEWGNFSVETLVDVTQCNGGAILPQSMGGIALYDMGNDLEVYPFDLRLAFAYETDTRQVCVEWQMPGSNPGHVTIPSNTRRCWLKLLHDEDAGQWQSYYKLSEAAPWSLLGTMNDTSLPEGGMAQPYLGLFGMTWGNHPQTSGGADFDFDYYHVNLECGAWGYNPADVNHDCMVDLIDFAELAFNWMKCSVPLQSGCYRY
ncbi:MAG: DUF2961 domain-containing protein [Sedimentisphaerales bacterium]|nr:DUF2961 domain-containing protein [Sedimentisphaerales bacterium]